MTPELRAIHDTLRSVGPHQPRPIRFLRTAPIADWRVKLYTIATHGEVARPAFVDEVVRRAPEIFPAGGTTEDRHGVGFVIAHDARTASIAIYYWWQSFNELHQRVFVGPKDDPAAMTQIANQTAGCVWELEIIDFERRAWLTDVLANRAGPDVERYLSRHLDTEL